MGTNRLPLTALRIPKYGINSNIHYRIYAIGRSLHAIHLSTPNPNPHPRLASHGASAPYVPGTPFPLIDGHGDPPLAEEGHIQAKQVAERLKNEPVKAIYVTSLTRTKETARPLAEALGLEMRVEKDLVSSERAEGAFASERASEMEDGKDIGQGLTKFSCRLSPLLLFLFVVLAFLLLLIPPLNFACSTLASPRLALQREIFLGDWEGGLFRAKAAAKDPAYLKAVAEGEWGHIPGKLRLYEASL